MKETGIIMSGDHPRLILEGKKTITRRTWGLKKINKDPDRYFDPDVYQSVIGAWFAWFGDKKSDSPVIVKCPYGGVGDRLWTKETLYRNPYFDEAGYLIDNTPVMINSTIGDMLKWRWKKDILPAMFMPKETSRILPEITELRAERLQEITPADCIAEGIATSVSCDAELQLRYRNLWDSLNSKKGHGWDKNDWVWAIGFRPVAPQGY